VSSVVPARPKDEQVSNDPTRGQIIFRATHLNQAEWTLQAPLNLLAFDFRIWHEADQAVALIKVCC